MVTWRFVEMCGWTSQNVTEVGEYLCLFWKLTQRTPCRVTLENQEDNGLGHIRHPLSTFTPILAQWTHEQSGHDGRDWGCVWVQAQGLSFTKADLAATTAESLTHQQLRPKLGTVPSQPLPAPTFRHWMPHTAWQIPRQIADFFFTVKSFYI